MSSGKFFWILCRSTDRILPKGDGRSAVVFEGGGIDIVQSFAEMCRADDLYGTAAGKKRHDEVVGYA